MGFPFKEANCFKQRCSKCCRDSICRRHLGSFSLFNGAVKTMVPFHFDLITNLKMWPKVKRHQRNFSPKDFRAISHGHVCRTTIQLNSSTEDHFCESAKILRTKFNASHDTLNFMTHDTSEHQHKPHAARRTHQASTHQTPSELNNHDLTCSKNGIQE